MLSVAVGHSYDPDAAEAIAEILEQCDEQLQGKIPQAGLLFAAIDFEHQLLLDRIMERFPDLELIGGTTDGELSSVEGFQQDSVSLTLFAADKIQIHAGVGRHVSQDVAAAVNHAVTQASDPLNGPLKLGIAIPDGLTFNNAMAIDLLNQHLEQTPLLGGAAAEELKCEQTYQFYKNEVLSDALPLLLFSGQLLLSHSFASGWKPIGKTGEVTRAEQNIIYEIDHQPAVAFYQHYFDDFAIDVVYPLAIFAPGEEQFFLRAALSHDPDQGSLTVGGNVPVHSKVQIADTNQDDIICAAKASFSQAWQSYPGKQPSAALFFSCAWRRWVLGQKTAAEEEAIAEFLDISIPYSGFYTFGEIAPLEEYSAAFLHNNTFVSVVLGSE